MNQDKTCETMGSACEPRMVCRKDFLLTAAGGAIVAGLVLPLPACVLDVLLILSISLTTAVLIIAFSARQILEARRFPLLIVAAATLRIAISVASAKLIFSGESAGTITNIFGQSIVRGNCAPAISVCFIVAIVVLGAVSRAAKSIRRTSSEFIKCIVPHKETGIRSDLNTGLINRDQAFDLREKITDETGFFVCMTGAARFMLFGTAIELAIITFNVIGCVTAGGTVPTTVETAAGMRFYESLRSSMLQTHAVATVGTGLIIQISSLLTALASGYLVRKGSIVAADMPFTDQTVKRVVAKEVSGSGTESLPKNSNANCSGAVEHTDDGLVQGDFSRATDEPFLLLSGPPQNGCPAELTEVTEPAATSDMCEKEAVAGDNNLSDEGNASHREARDRKDTAPDYESGDYYDAVTKLIEANLADETRTLLMCAENVAGLPVTIPVNVTMRLAQKGRRCLLVDLDLERNAIGKVFDAGSSSFQPGETQARPTCISNLWVWPASNFNRNGEASAPMKLEDSIAGLRGQYDLLIVYAPNIELVAERGQLAHCVQAAIFFEDQSKETANPIVMDFRRLLIDGGCKVFESKGIIAKSAWELPKTG